MKRVVVTGLGLVTPLGCGVDYNWKNLLAGVSGAKIISKFNPENFKCKVACEVPLGLSSDGKFDPEEWIEKKEIKKIDDFIQFSMAASEQAFKDSNISISEKLSLRSGCIIGSGIGGLQGIEKTALDFHINKKRISPFFITGRLINMASGYASLKYNLKGPNYSTVSACASGAHAIGESMRLIQSGKMDMMLTGGAEGAITPIGIEGFTACRALSTNYNDDPAKASRPFDKDRDGFVMGEGAGILILEEYEHAINRGANIHCEITGYGMSADAYHYTLPEPTGDGAKRAMLGALEDAKMKPGLIDYINAHGTSTQAGDQVEIKAIQDVFTDNNQDICLSSTKSQTGHLLGAAGAIEAIYSILTIKSQTMPAAINIDNPIEHHKLKLIKDKAESKKITNVLSNSFGFGGTNVSLIFTNIN
jgi:3-oxoacyl-[acyl-carrier-protein] synthase II|tara:strand:+ start:1695 stop:2951 length:1257 start_codon:yes stop_codon:yes gene_type:complete